VIDREAKYFSGDGAPYAVAHHSALVYTFPEFYPSTQYIGSKRLIFPSGGAELLNIGLGHFSWAKFQVHRRARVHSCVIAQPGAALVWGFAGGETKLNSMK
jgi:hypothetical protein